MIYTEHLYWIWRINALCVYSSHCPAHFFFQAKIFFHLLSFYKNYWDCSFYFFLYHTRWQKHPPRFCLVFKSLPYHYVPTSHSVVNFTLFWRCICPCMTPCMAKLVWPSSSFKHNMGKGGWVRVRVWKERAPPHPYPSCKDSQPLQGNMKPSTHIP